MNLRVTLNCQVKPGQFKDLKPFLEENLSNVRGFSGCRSVKLFFNREKSELLIEEEWVDQSTHQSYMQAIEQSGVLGELASFLQGPPDIGYFEPLEI